ncbi:head GIN domain-containing protein [Echinicola jeungdonensis]|uniref:Head GIN domain-containing protein n=1 Tax=Echinicola jeungdonensis TaxID=709343 RepID=A0ABV5J863_9BACT|nr:head GIN domain-containing protein [Echinicola jeungdonensis]MDN3669678.1 head GIN domain-containing protein [Echinicola jeungdonensis]
MKKQFAILLGLALMVFSAGALAQTSKDSRELSSFRAVKVANSIEAELVKGTRNHIEITASGVDVGDVETEVKKQQLIVGLSHGNFGSNTVKVTITYVDIEEVEALTGAKVFVKNVIENKSVTLRAYTNSYLEAKVRAAKLDLETSTNGKIFIEGKAEDLILEAFTKSEISGPDLIVENAQVRTNTAANSTITVNNSIKGSAATAGKVWFHGEPKLVDVKSNTGGEISHMKRAEKESSKDN